MGDRTATVEQLDAVAQAAKAALIAMADVMAVIVDRGLAAEVVTDLMVARHRGKMATLQRALETAGYLGPRQTRPAP